MRWTQEMNKNVMRAYFRAVGGETGWTGYRTVMHREFLLLEPNLTAIEQNLADRARYIQRKGVFNAAELERIRREAASEVEPVSTKHNAVVTQQESVLSEVPVDAMLKKPSPKK